MNPIDVKLTIYVHPEVLDDLSWCERKTNYPGLGEEISSVLRLLAVQGKLSGEYPLRYLPQHLQACSFHAYIFLPRLNRGKIHGPRVAYTVEDNIARILYIGGHKDSRYEDQKSFAVLFAERYELDIAQFGVYNPMTKELPQFDTNNE